MSMRARMGVAVAGMILVLPTSMAAQVQSWQEVQIADIEQMGGKFHALAEAFDESQYDWLPMEGTRSVRDVLGLAIAEARLFPMLWGHAAAPGSVTNFNEAEARAAALSKEEMLSEIESSFEFFAGAVGEMTEEQRMADGNFFGQAMPVHASLEMAVTDMHEHLGQLIAYARTNHVVPPWSR